MKMQEQLLWILDKPRVGLDNLDERIKENVAFVHSLGRKCDSVGWSELKREDPRAEEILQKIQSFCKENRWFVRGLYIREYTELVTDWYALEGAYFQDDTLGDVTEVPTRKRGTVKVGDIKAYRELTAAPKYWGRDLYVPERFYNACQKLGIKDLEFCWAKDTGKYAAEQYFAVFGLKRIPRVAVTWELKKKNWKKLGDDGGWLPRLGEIVSQWSQLQIPYCYRKKDMPKGGIAYAYVPNKKGHSCLYQVLIHKDVAQQLLAEKALPQSALQPVAVVDRIPAGYDLQKTKDLPRPEKAWLQQHWEAYKALKKEERPVWQISDKEALKILRKAKTEKKENFGKKLPKASAEALQETSHAPMLPYYLVANGGYLSDEYCLLSVDDSKTETESFFKEMEREELLQEKPVGIVIGKCVNADVVLLLQNGSVVRFSHEAPETVNQWPSLAQFVVDTINNT